MALDFHKYAEEGTTFVKELARELKCPDDYDRAARVLRAVLHTLRDMITTDESLQFVSQLPMFLKAAYVDGWSSSRKERISNVNEFFQRIREHDSPVGFHDFPGKGFDERAVITVMSQLQDYVAPGELDDIVSQLPKEIGYMFSPVEG
jgi:uncharacterized protein (DUF2267 family)